ncbi:MAG: 1-acylglycerol-3-phosphate O-acyltransferase [Oscillospiraceae bacterium]|nr:1-acylglycerol-3-phosphate O-acyltransferase [Oscillospiraceae bacterium]
MNRFYKFAIAVLRRVMPLWYKLETDGLENLPEDSGYLFVSNHRSNADPILIGVQNPETQFCFLAKQELFSDGLVGWLLRKLGAVAVDRGAGDVDALEEIAYRLQNGENALIFPEGTRSKDGTLGHFKTGAALIAAQTGVPVVPVAISFEDELHFRSTIYIRYGAPFEIPTTDVSDPSPAVLKQVRREMQSHVAALLELNEKAMTDAQLAALPDFGEPEAETPEPEPRNRKSAAEADQQKPEKQAETGSPKQNRPQKDPETESDEKKKTVPMPAARPKAVKKPVAVVAASRSKGENDAAEKPAGTAADRIMKTEETKKSEESELKMSKNHLQDQPEDQIKENKTGEEIIEKTKKKADSVTGELEEIISGVEKEVSETADKVSGKVKKQADKAAEKTEKAKDKIGKLKDDAAEELSDAANDAADEIDEIIDDAETVADDADYDPEAEDYIDEGDDYITDEEDYDPDEDIRQAMEEANAESLPFRLKNPFKKKRNADAEPVDDVDVPLDDEYDDGAGKSGLLGGLSLKNPFRKKDADEYDEEYDEDYDEEYDEEYDDEDYDDEEGGHRFDYGRLALILTFAILGIFAIDFARRVIHQWRNDKGNLEISSMESASVESMNTPETTLPVEGTTAIPEQTKMTIPITTMTTTALTTTASGGSTGVGTVIDNRETETQVVPNDAVRSGSLVLIDNDHPQGFTPTLVPFSNIPYQHLRLVRTEDVVDSSVSTPLCTMFNDFFNATGIGNIMVYNTTGAPTYPPYSVSLPERASGLTLDFAILNEAAQSHVPYTPDGNYAWLTEHAADYGFIVRYPADKAEVTGQNGMTWHFRYVGAPHARYMADNGICLEEYLKLIAQHTWNTEHLKATVLGTEYEMYYVPADETNATTEIKFPKNEDGIVPMISGDNIDGFVVAIAKH